MMHGWNGGWSWSSVYSARPFVIELPCTNLGGSSSSSNLMITHEKDTTIPGSSSQNNSLTAIVKKNDTPSIVQLSAKERKTVINNLMPNPARDFIDVEIESNFEGQVAFRIFDSKGSLIRVIEETLIDGSNVVRIDINQLESGFHYLMITDQEDTMVTRKFIKVW